jgi:predicted O-methyltransferase YrrM
MRVEEVLKSIEEEAPRDDLPILGPAKRRIIEEIIVKHRPVYALEIGTLVGYSAITIANLLPREGRLTCLEISSDLAAKARSNIEKAGLSFKVDIVVGDARKSALKLRRLMDFLLIDASKAEYLQFLQTSEHLLHSGSVIVADNVKIFADQVKDYLNYVRTSGRYESRTVDVPLQADRNVIDAMEVSFRL